MTKSWPLERALQLLDIVAGAGREMSLVEMAAASGLPQSSTFRLTASLRASGMLVFDNNRKVYRLGPRAERLALMMRGQPAIEALLASALHALSELAHETTFFVMRGANGHRLMKYQVPEVGARAFIHPGYEFPEHATAAGKAIRAFMGKGDAAGTATEPLVRYQPGTVTSQAELQRTYGSIRESGYAVNDSELDPGVFSLAAPVFIKQDVIGALGIVGPRERMLVSIAELKLADALMQAAREVSCLVAL